MSNSKYQIDSDDIQDQVRHHLSCKPNGYLGYEYGSDVKAMLQTAQSSGMAESFIATLHRDVPLTAVVGGVSVYSRDHDEDGKEIIIEVANRLIAGS